MKPARAARSIVFISVLASGLAALSAPAGANDELAHYVAAPDSSYSWRELGKGRIGSVEYVELLLTSQTWRDVSWKHQLFVLRPKSIDTTLKQGFLFIHGGRWKPEYENGINGDLPREARIFAALAESLHAPLAILRQVPFQPMFERTEDALIAHTFDQYLKTGDVSWPLLLPMAKSASRAMDAVQEFTRERWNIPLERFTVSGASKRGWTSWLTAAADPRIAAVAPMVIDMLNIPAQIDLQRAAFGSLSEQVQDYADINLAERIDSEYGRKLLDLVDPFSYREQFTQFKLIVLGTNDRYWPLNALNVYWGSLPDPKRVLYVPNQGHGVDDVERLLGSLSALHRYSSRGEPLPALDWSFETRTGEIEVTVQSDRRPARVRAWTAHSDSRDFRESKWRSHACSRRGESYVCRRPVVQDKLTALYAEASFKDQGERTFSLSTTVCIVGATPESKIGC